MRRLNVSPGKVMHELVKIAIHGHLDRTDDEGVLPGNVDAVVRRVLRAPDGVPTEEKNGGEADDRKYATREIQQGDRSDGEPDGRRCARGRHDGHRHDTKK